MAARRKADRLIADGRVSVNGNLASAGQEVSPDKDEVRLDGEPVRLQQRQTYILLNKPVGVLSSVGDPHGRTTVVDGLPVDAGRVFPVGRLDLDSRGLILLTDDGELAARLMHPRYHVEKEYVVLISGRPGEQSLSRLAEGMVVKGESFAPISVRVLDAGTTQSLVGMVLSEGKRREIRRLWQALGHRVLDLQRIRLDGLLLGDLPEGSWRPLERAEVLAVRAAAGLE
ncbi:MAG TPA: pseudouridine synthase [Candidatus Dormibacteraeota bacterium]|nr:pseudouridine synthase [Candidatus Dormibacteraeota bacterium]